MRLHPLLTLTGAISCSGDESRGFPEPLPEPICEPGAQQDCRCLPNLQAGLQICADGGVGWGDCQCGPSGPGEGEGTFDSAVVRDVGETPRGIEWDDVDGDGLVDLAVASFGNDSFFVVDAESEMRWERCDDGNVDDDDGCAADCTVEDGFVCVGQGDGSCVAQ